MNETVSGVIEDLKTSTFEKEGKTKQRGVITVAGKRISGFGEIPAPVQRAHDEGLHVCVTYELKGQYMNYRNLTLQESVQEQDVSGFRPGGEVGKVSLLNLIEANAAMFQQCVDASETIWKGREASVEDVRTTAVSLFIQTMKDLERLGMKQRLELRGLSP